MDGRWTIHLFGGLKAIQDDRVLTRFRTQKTAALLAYLAYHRHHSHPREMLIEMLWPDCEPHAGRQNLSQALSSLRRQFEPPGLPAGAVLVADRLFVRLNPETVTSDVALFEAAIEAAERTHSAVEQRRALGQAVGLYRGELLVGYYDDWILAERDRQQERHVQALRRLTHLLEQSGDFPHALDHARRALAIDPLREELHRDLMRLLAAAGQPAAALCQYQELQRVLKEELDEPPSLATRQFVNELRRSALQVGPASDADEVGSFRPRRNLFSLPRLRTDAAALPTGTVTLLLVELADRLDTEEGQAPAAGRALRVVHREIRRQEGHVVHEAGGSLLAAFGRASEALAVAIAALQTLAPSNWQSSGPEAIPPEPTDHRMVEAETRMALHTGEITLQAGHYHGLALDHVARVLLAAQCGQLLCSEATAALLRAEAEPGKPDLRLVDLGLYRLPDMASGVTTTERLFQVSYPGMPQREFPPPRAEPVHSGSLPLTLSRFFGREEELLRLTEILLDEDRRLVTLTGPGGIGKTRLALELAKQSSGPARRAVWFVSLADLRDARLIGTAIRDAIGLPRIAEIEIREQVVEALSCQPTLLVLDNFEHLAAEGASLVYMLLERVPALTCLVTSRQRLNLSGEREFPVLPLPTPTSGAQDLRLSGTERLSPRAPERLLELASVQLFTDRAQGVQPDFQITRRNATAVGEVCRRLEGIPLALELAAARVKQFPPAALLERLASPLNLLTRGARDLPLRQQTLRSTIQWSYDLLTEEEKALFRRLAVFVGGCTLPAAQAVGNPKAEAGIDVVEGIASLIDKSLLRQDEGLGGEPRFRMLETIREFGIECLESRGDAEEQRGYHHGFFLHLAEEAEPHLEGPEGTKWRARLDADQENLRAALTWSVVERNQPEHGLRLAVALLWSWHGRAQLAEGGSWLERALAAASEAPAPLRARALTGAGIMASLLCEYDRAIPLHQEALTLFRALDDPQGIVWALNNLGCQAFGKGDYDQARLFLVESVSLARQLGFTGPAGWAPLHHLGLVADAIGDFDQAQAIWEECLRRDPPSNGGERLALNNLGWVAFHRGDYEEAGDLIEECLTLYQHADEVPPVAVLHSLGLVSLRRGDTPRAASLFREALDLLDSRVWLHKVHTAECLEGLAGVAGAQGQPERAACLFGAAEALREDFGGPMWPSDRVEYERNVSLARAALSEAASGNAGEPHARFAARWAAGRAMPAERAVAIAREDVAAE